MRTPSARQILRSSMQPRHIDCSHRSRGGLAFEVVRMFPTLGVAPCRFRRRPHDEARRTTFINRLAGESKVAHLRTHK